VEFGDEGVRGNVEIGIRRWGFFIWGELKRNCNYIGDMYL
jgi:hypothetical protein